MLWLVLGAWRGEHPPEARSVRLSSRINSAAVVDKRPSGRGKGKKEKVRLVEAERKYKVTQINDNCEREGSTRWCSCDIAP